MTLKPVIAMASRHDSQPALKPILRVLQAPPSRSHILDYPYNRAILYASSPRHAPGLFIKYRAIFTVDADLSRN